MPELLTYFLGLGLGVGVALGMVLTCRDPRENSGYIQDVADGLPPASWSKACVATVEAWLDAQEAGSGEPARPRQEAERLSIAREKMRDYEEFIEPSIARMLEGAMLSFWAALAVDELVRQRAAAESALS